MFICCKFVLINIFYFFIVIVKQNTNYNTVQKATVSCRTLKIAAKPTLVDSV